MSCREYRPSNGLSLLSLRFFRTHPSQACATSWSAWRYDALYARNSWERTASWEALRARGMWAPRDISHLYRPNPRKLFNDKNLLHSLTSLSPFLRTWKSSVGLSNCKMRSLGSLVECRNHPMTMYGFGVGMMLSTCRFISSLVASTRRKKTGHCLLDDREWLPRCLEVLKLPRSLATKFCFVSEVCVSVTNSGCRHGGAEDSGDGSCFVLDKASSIIGSMVPLGWGVRPRWGVPFAILTRLFSLSASRTRIEAFFRILFRLAIK